MTQLRETPLVPQGRTRAAIVAAALEVFATDGSTATLDDVAGAAGISRATLYRYFSSREELFAALLDEAYADVLARMRAAHTDEVPFGEALARAARATAITGTQFIALCSEPLSAKPHDLDAEYERIMEALFESWSALTVAALRHGSAEGLGPEPIAALLVDQFLAGAAS